ncbi:hypothetical protein Tco_0303993 [Tanacetum coccineum]
MSFGADGWENVTTPIPAAAAADGEALYDQRGYLFGKTPLKHLCDCHGVFVLTFVGVVYWINGVPLFE